MPPPFPYTFYACPCTEQESAYPSQAKDSTQEEAGELTFNPHDPKSTYALHTLDHLLFCDDCHQIKCARCVSEEVVHYYCPNCLFEVPSSTAKDDGNRCSRNCYSCPQCTSPLTVSALDIKAESAEEDTYILSCQYCSWSSLDIDVRFEKPTKITDQLKRARKAQHDSHDESVQQHMSVEERFTTLEAFYKEQLVASGEATGGAGYAGYGSPANLSRIINLYGGISHNALRKTQEKPAPMREALAEEGLEQYDGKTSEADTIQKMSELGWHGTASAEQQHAAPVNHGARLLQDLWPAPVLLKTKRGKRCRQCKQFVFRPDQRLNGPRPRLRIIAMNFIPRLSLRPLDSARPVVNHSFYLKHEQPPNQPLLQPHVPQQYALTLRNPIFETVKVTLATSANTPGRVASKVTILCPSFTIGPAGDVWDEALSTPTTGAGDGSRKAAMASLTGNNESERQPEAGKVWEQTRNSTTVVLEIVPGALSPMPSIVPSHTASTTQFEEGDDILEVPVYVRVEWTAELVTEGEQKGTTERVARELAYWCVLGVGRIAK